MNRADVVTRQPVINLPSRVDLDAWLVTQSLPQAAEHPIWRPSGGRRVDVRGREHLAVLLSSMPKRRQSFGTVEWPRAFPQPWAQTRSSGDGFIAELNDGAMPPGREFPCTRRAYRGQPGEYPIPDESDARYKSSRYPSQPHEIFSALEAADLIWTWINTMTLPSGIAVTMRHFGASERRGFGCGDL
jgi:hypothetical protein